MRDLTFGEMDFVVGGVPVSRPTRTPITSCTIGIYGGALAGGVSRANSGWAGATLGALGGAIAGFFSKCF
jgi:outer membrane lipoprotein SlyB